MKRDFEGVQADLQYSFLQHEQHSDYMQGLVDESRLPQPNSNITDGGELAASLIVGGNFADGRGNATGNLSYIESEPTRLADRDYAACQARGNHRRGGLCRFLQLEQRRIDCERRELGGSGDQLIPYGSSTTSPPTVFNSNPYMNLLHGRERNQAGVLAKYAFSETRGNLRGFHVHAGQGQHGGRAFRPVHDQRG